MAAKKNKVRLKGKERLSLYSDLSTMLTAGIPILDAIESLQTDSKGNLKKVLAELHKALANGLPLSHAMEQLPLAFDAITVNLIRAAETGGTLEETLHDVVLSTKKELAFSDQLRSTMIYPAFVMVVFMAIVVLMLTFVIPKISKVFSTMHVHIPAFTKAMFNASAFFVQHWLIATGVFIAGLVILGIIISANKKAIVNLLLSLPVLNVLGRNIDFTRFSRSFGLLMHAGVPVDEALELSERVVQKKQIAAIVRRMRDDVELGRPLSHSLRQAHSVVPPLMSRSLETAESSGTLDQTLQNLTEYFDEQVAGSLKVISSLVEPVLLVIVGGMVGTLMITIIAPIYGLISQINPKS